MPDYFSHFICAEKIYEKLGGEKSKIKSRPLYLLGAQGGDVLFAYNMKFSKNNLGRAIHNMPAEEVFKALSQGDPSYAAGFATHYALDCTLHPAVYAYENNHSSPFAHQKLEADLGLYISRLYGVRRRILPRESVLECTSAVYDTIKPLCPEITVTGVERCLKRHFNYSRYLFKTKRQSYKCDFDFPSLAGAVQEAVGLGTEAVNCVLSRNIDAAVFSKAFLQH
ncbi:MAG: hypothetical protein K2L42_05315 [Clostridia bacterium]|nr:hypothetical protein [Clostridia bacterium]